MTDRPIERHLPAVVKALASLRVMETDQHPLTGKLWLSYYEGYLQKVEQVIELRKS